MPSNLNTILNGAVLQVLNNVDSIPRVSSQVGNIILPSSGSFYDYFFPVVVSPGTSFTLPVSPCWVAYVKNLGGLNASPAGNITVQIQVVGGALVTAANSPIIPPGGLWMYWNAAETAGGIIAMTLIASVANTPVEILLAG